MTDDISKEGPIGRIRYVRYDQGIVTNDHTYLPLESALEVLVNGRPHSLLMRSPGFDRELVTGYLFTEGLIESANEVGRMEFEPGSSFMGGQGVRAKVELPGLDTCLGLPERPSISLASCGLCGKEDLERLGGRLSRVKSKHTVSWETLWELLTDLTRHQPLYELTHGVHAVALYNVQGQFLCCYEDVGRHNALDKIIGHILLNGWEFQDKVAVLSGRASLEMVMKCARAGIPVLLCFSSPTILAVEAAKAFNLTLVGQHEKQYLAGFTHTRRINQLLSTLFYPGRWEFGENRRAWCHDCQDKPPRREPAPRNKSGRP